MQAFLIAMTLALALVAGISHASSLPLDTGVVINEHSGGTNAAGCHNDRKRGTYHCH